MYRFSGIYKRLCSPVCLRGQAQRQRYNFKVCIFNSFVLSVLVLLCPWCFLCISFSVAAGAEPFLSGTSSLYVEQMYESWKKDPQSVHKVWV